MLNDLDQAAVEGVGPFALAIAKTGPYQDHLAILYRDECDDIWIMHLGWHNRLYTDVFCFIYQWAPTNRPRPILKFLSHLCDKIRKNKPVIPYGLDRTGIQIDKQTGSVNPSKVGKGLTCATFPLALFDAYKIKLLAEDEWPKDANAPWQQYIYDMMCDEKTDVPVDHREALKSDIGGARRFTPAEVIGASTRNRWPIGFKEAGRLASKVAADMKPFDPRIHEANG